MSNKILGRSADAGKCLPRRLTYSIIVIMHNEISSLIAAALREDFDKSGDITSDAVVGPECVKAVVKSKSQGVLAGREVFEEVFRTIDETCTVHFLCRDGETCAPDMLVAELSGAARSLLGGERTALNFLSFLSGIATTTRRFVTEAARYGQTIILDTRKTLPGIQNALETGGPGGRGV